MKLRQHYLAFLFFKAATILYFKSCFYLYLNLSKNIMIENIEKRMETYIKV